MFKSAFRSLSPLRLERRTARASPEGSALLGVAEADQSATQPVMPGPGDNERALVEGLDEPALVVEGSIVRLANAPARRLLGPRIEGRDIRLAIRHPQALDAILAHRTGEVDATGIVEPGRSWRLVVRNLWPGAALVRMVDRSDAVSAEKMRVDFVANASHELRTPLSTVLGYAETLAEESDLPDELRSNFGRTIRDEAGRMLRIIEDLMSLSRIEADRFVAPGERVKIDDIMAAAVSNAGHLRGSAKSELKVDVPENLPLVRGDRAQLIQVVDNLVSNALRYGCDGPGSIIHIAAERSGPWVTISVTDHGPGIPREHLHRVTERFYRVDPARSRESGGTGLGLAIVKHIIERHRGSLEIRSTVGVGTSVTVRLPVAA
jgi:two-component system, OmpR family, phosphate regulon sensor histidine kinase PhoR